MAPDLLECLRADATQGLATAGSTPEPVIEPTRDAAKDYAPSIETDVSHLAISIHTVLSTREKHR
jgi:hypothetical protein